MNKSGRYYALCGLALSIALIVLAVAGLQVMEQSKSEHAAALVQRLLDADIAQVPGVVKDMAGCRTWIDPLLREEDKKAAKDAQRLRVSLALLPADPGQVECLYERLLDADPLEVPVIRDALVPYKEALTSQLWSVVERPAKGKESQRLRAASALAAYDPSSPRWKTVSRQIADDLVKCAGGLSDVLDGVPSARPRPLVHSAGCDFSGHESRGD